ncbi:MAG TPA: c-type cytochrome [Thermomicrobiales bacterium]|nr:c-type cytochrome [Thermomicrobiales bacterium]
MGAVQKLATVVIIGLVAMATVLVVVLADEPVRRDSETTEQEALALERGTSLYITYCLQCHGPSGYGAAGDEDPHRVGARLNQDPNALDLENPQTIVFQSDDPVMQQRAEAYIRYSIIYGKPSDPRLSPKVMPAFGQDLNVEEVNDLVYLLMYGDWDYVYNEAVLATGHSQAQADCDADPSNEEACENAHNDEYALYPTVPPPADAGEDEESATPATSEDGAVLLEAQDPFNWSATELTVAPGDTIEVVNVGALDHDFTVDEFGIAEPLAPGGGPVTITIPADAAPGEYRFYCSIPGHAESGMVGTLIVEG